MISMNNTIINTSSYPAIILPEKFISQDDWFYSIYEYVCVEYRDFLEKIVNEAYKEIYEFRDKYADVYLREYFPARLFEFNDVTFEERIERCNWWGHIDLKCSRTGYEGNSLCKKTRADNPYFYSMVDLQWVTPIAKCVFLYLISFLSKRTIIADPKSYKRIKLFLIYESKYGIPMDEYRSFIEELRYLIDKTKNIYSEVEFECYYLEYLNRLRSNFEYKKKYLRVIKNYYRDVESGSIWLWESRYSPHGYSDNEIGFVNPRIKKKGNRFKV